MERSSSSGRLEELLAHRAWVRRVARALVLDESRADDLEQEVWLRALRAEEPRSPRAWLGTVLRRVASNARRDEGRQRAHEGLASPKAPVPGPQERIERAEVIGDSEFHGTLRNGQRFTVTREWIERIAAVNRELGGRAVAWRRVRV